MDDIKRATAIYSGGCIYIYFAELENGNWLMGDDEGTMVIVNTNPLADEETFDDSMFYEWQQKHLVREIPAEEYHEKLNAVLDVIFKGDTMPDHDNYCIDELKVRYKSAENTLAEDQLQLAEKIRECFILQVELVNAAMADIVKYNASDEILDYVCYVGHCNLDGSEEDFIRVEFGGAYAFLDIVNGTPTGDPVWWNNEDLGCSGCNYEGTIAKLNSMPPEEILDCEEAHYIESGDELTVPAYVPYDTCPRQVKRR